MKQFALPIVKALAFLAIAATAHAGTIKEKLAGNTSVLEGTEFKAQDIQGEPEYYILYFSASW
ncbi:hypothetical protein [Sulfuriroseicoccus oceanibius]|uniref:Uncharacterized protein n=1 Tax=Sulfuriroseicoccus oceanibius TaxID=2707525 RepID=A0A6B3LF26_9BACT|nr:hypothetical protein [Sulfuriroseicoccus oceanibius]QQL44932.1 hypothetical protein G3M56_013860 [Sulfuriroseicoccus oceanibius]